MAVPAIRHILHVAKGAFSEGAQNSVCRQLSELGFVRLGDGL